MLAKEGKQLGDIAVIFAPQLSAEYTQLLQSSETFKNWKGKWHESSEAVGNSTLTAPYQIQSAIEKNEVVQGDLGIIINMGAGLQIGCASYKF